MSYCGVLLAAGVSTEYEEKNRGERMSLPSGSINDEFGDETPRFFGGCENSPNGVPVFFLEPFIRRDLTNSGSAEQLRA